MHVEKTVGDRISRDGPGDTENALLDFEKNCEAANVIGARRLVMHLWGGVDSDRHIEHNLATECAPTGARECPQTTQWGFPCVT